MLKNKKAIYVLIPLNIIIWVYLGYSIYDGLRGEDIPIVETESTALKLKPENEGEAYKLSLNYDDPFLKDGPKPKNNGNNASSNPNQQSTVVKQMPAVKTPTVAPVVKPPADIKYLGLVKNNNTGIATALISLNGKSFVVKKGDVIETLSVKEVASDYVELKEGKNIMKISKN